MDYYVKLRMGLNATMSQPTTIKEASGNKRKNFAFIYEIISLQNSAYIQ